MDKVNNFKKRKKSKSWFFWIFFWIVAMIFLIAWWIFWDIKDGGYIQTIKYAKPVVKVLPMSTESKEKLSTTLEIIEKIAQKKETQSFLILFQNNNELRPGGGYIGSFGILKIKGEKVLSVDIHDSNVFDSRGETKITPPYPMAQMLNIKDWEFRDSNWSPDFPTNAKNAQEFYKILGGEESFDGVVAISTNVLETFLKATGSIIVEGYPGEYNYDNVIDKLQYQVERGYVDQGIEEGKRKFVMKDLAREIIFKVQNFSWKEKKELIGDLEDHLKRKDVMIYFQDELIQKEVKRMNWSGDLTPWGGDFLMMVDANMASLKSDRFIKRKFLYTVDFSLDKPMANLKIDYQHTARTRDWSTTDYDSFLRVYVPRQSWMIESYGTNTPQFGNEKGFKSFGFLARVSLGKTKNVEIDYYIDPKISFDNYALKIQKQSGVKTLEGMIRIISPTGKAYEKEVFVENEKIFKLKNE